MMYKPAMAAGAFFAALAVILGAFAAHALKAVMAIDQLAIFETGVRYQFYHSIGLFVVGIAYQSFPSKMIKVAANFFITGILLFSGSLYAMTLMSINHLTLGPLGIITPVGGLFFILGWVMIMLGVLKKN